MSEMTLPAIVDNATAERPMEKSRRSPTPPRVQPAKWKDVAFEWLTRFFAFLVFSILAAILVSLAIGSAPSQLSAGHHGY